MVPLRLDYFEKRDIDSSTLYSISRQFQLLHADIVNLEFLGKLVIHPKYCLLVINMFTSKIYTYPMKLRRKLVRKLKEFYIDIAKKKETTKGCVLKLIKSSSKMKLKKLNEKFSVDMFLTKIHCENLFSAEEKTCELKKRILKLNGIKSKSKVITLTILIKKSTDNMNDTESEKYGYVPNYV